MNKGTYLEKVDVVRIARVLYRQHKGITEQFELFIRTACRDTGWNFSDTYAAVFMNEEEYQTWLQKQ